MGAGASVYEITKTHGELQDLIGTLNDTQINDIAADLGISNKRNIHTVKDAQHLVTSISEDEARQKIEKLTDLKKQYNLKGGRRRNRRNTRKTRHLRRRSTKSRSYAKRRI